MKNYCINSKSKLFSLPAGGWALYTIKKNIYRTWIKVNISYLSYTIMSVAFKLGREWTNDEIQRFLTDYIEDDYYFLILERRHNIDPFLIFEDKKESYRDCYKGSINLILKNPTTTSISFRISYFEECENKSSK